MLSETNIDQAGLLLLVVVNVVAFCLVCSLALLIREFWRVWKKRKHRRLP